MVGLGCEVFQIARLKHRYGLVEGGAFRTMTIQDTGGTRKTIEAGVARIREMLPIADLATLTAIYRRFIDGYFAPR